MKVLFFHHAINLGGAPNSLALLIKSLDKAAFSPIVAMPKRANNEIVRDLFLDAGAEVVEERDIRPFHGSTVAPNARLSEKLYALAGYPLLLRCAARLVREIRPDIVHLNSSCMVAAAQATRRVRPDLPVICHVREPILNNPWGEILRRLNRRYCTHFISIDNAGDASISAPTQARSVVYNAVDTSFFEIIEHRQRHEKVFLSLSRVTPANGILEFVESLERLKGRLPPKLRFAIAGFTGKGSYEARCMEAIKRSDVCEARPFLNNVRAEIAACDVIVAPFATAHSARSVLEGAAMGRAALVTRLPNLMELIVDGVTGTCYDSTDDESLLAAITHLADDSTCTDMGKSARHFALRTFHPASNAAAVEHIYRAHSRRT